MAGIVNERRVVVGLADTIFLQHGKLIDVSRERVTILIIVGIDGTRDMIVVENVLHLTRGEILAGNARLATGHKCEGQQSQKPCYGIFHRRRLRVRGVRGGLGG